MAYEQKDNSGSLFKNDRREKDTHANARGSAMIGGVEYWVDAWTNEDRNGNKYQALKFKPKEDRDQQHRQKLGTGPTVDRYADDDSDVPF